MNLNEVLRNLIEEHGITQKQLALSLNIAPSTLGGYVQGTSEPDIATLKMLAKYFNISMDYLLDFPTEPASNFKENDILRIFRALSEDQKNFYIEQGKLILKFGKKMP